ncbi:MAG: vitamin B12 dependent-methionine synthase activation domain-containing protein, partial [Terrimicrobiaceae bacterium]
EAGMIQVNLPTAGMDFHAPFTGRKQAGYGPAEKGSYAREFFTAVKVTQHYAQGVVHVLDASRSVNVASALLSPEQKPAFLEKLNSDYETLRQEHAGKQAGRPQLPLEEASANKFLGSWSEITRPSQLGIIPVDVSLEELVPYFDWSPFFHAWELRGRFPGLLDDPEIGVEARKLYDDARHLLDEIVAKKLFRPRGVMGFWRAASTGEDIQLFDASGAKLEVLHGLRQQQKKPAGQSNFSLADFVAPESSGLEDFVGAFAVTAGPEVHDVADSYEKKHDDYLSIMTKALGDRFAEAYAECLHKKAREIWGFGQGENLTPEELIREKYRGIRPAPGYPSQPDHTEKWALWRLLDAERHTGITLTESLAMFPGSSVSGLYFGHPESKYFAVGKIERDQVESYASRKGMPVLEIEKWLRPYLNYDPDSILIRPCQPGAKL